MAHSSLNLKIKLWNTTKKKLFLLSMQINEWYFFLHDNLFQTKLENFVVIAFSHMPCGYGSKKIKDRN